MYIITLQPKTGYPLKLSRADPGQLLGWETSWKTRFAAGRGVLVRLARGAQPTVCLGPNAPV